MNLIGLEFFDELVECHKETISIKDKYSRMRSLLERVCKEITSKETIQFSNLFSRLNHVCDRTALSKNKAYKLNTFRIHANKVLHAEFSPTTVDYFQDLKALSYALSHFYGIPVPNELFQLLPKTDNYIPVIRRAEKHDRLRVEVSYTDNEYIYAFDENNSSEDPIKIKYDLPDTNEEFNSSVTVLWKGCQLNLIDVSIDDCGIYVPDLIIVEPDYLIDVSALAECIKEYGSHPLNYIQSKFEAIKNSKHILLGNAANIFLDDFVNEKSPNPVVYADSMRKVFKAAPFEFSTCIDLVSKENELEFFEGTKSQFQNIQSVVNNSFPTKGINRETGILEPSFICEHLGVQGRLDYLQLLPKEGKQFVIELKSGKAPFPDSNFELIGKNHNAQLFLYQIIIQKVLGVEFKNLQTLVLYSKYANSTANLRTSRAFMKAIREILNIRNIIVFNEYSIAADRQGNRTKELIAEISASTLITSTTISPSFLENYIIPQIVKFKGPFLSSTPLELEYFHSLYSFVTKEHYISKLQIGNLDQQRNGSYWTDTVSKINDGEILYDLVLSAGGNNSDATIPVVTLNIPEYDTDYLPNFRKGDIVILYERNYDSDNVTNKQIFKGSIQELNPQEIKVRFRNKQRNISVLPEKSKYAIEHDCLDSSYSSMYRGLYAFLQANQDRKDLLLNQKQPEQDITNELGNVFDSPEMQQIIYKSKIAKDYFLLIGPPGTGKTSIALKSMVEEFTIEPDFNILLLSYTNRAVDEICDALDKVQDQPAYIRIGSELSCDGKHRHRLLDMTIEGCKNRAEVRNKIESHRIFVGTVASISGKTELFKFKHFQVAIIDEASQILEPSLIGILCAKNKDGSNAIDKFILIGDHKQLPAVVLQDEEESRVDNQELNTIGLFNRRNSFFERLYNLHKTNKKSLVWGKLFKQGRMHPHIAAFPNYAFYNNELKPVPTKHQSSDLAYKIYNQDNALEKLLATQRLAFIPSEIFIGDKSNKTNSHEAKISSKLVETIYYLYKQNALEFLSAETLGIITPYRNQIALIKREIHKLKIPELDDISVDTVERFQGSQRDIIIYSFSVNTYGQLAFLANNIEVEGQLVDRKLNVALTRAKKQLFITGNPSILSNNFNYFRLIEFIRSKSGYINATPQTFLEGKFEIDEPDIEVEIGGKIYEPDQDFKSTFEQLVSNQIIAKSPNYPEEIFGNSHDYNRVNLLQFGRANFDQATLEFSAIDKVNLYCFYNMRKHYFSSLAIFKSFENYFKSVFFNSNNRITFIDFGCGPLTSGLAFNQQFASAKNFYFNYVGIDIANAMLSKAREFAGSGLFSKDLKFQFKNSMEEVSGDYWESVFSLSNTVILNFSYVFGNVDNEIVQMLAAQINILMDRFTLNKYVLIFQNSSLEKRNRTYINFKKLVPRLTSITEPKTETITYKNAKMSKYDKSETVYYELLSN